MTDPQRTPPYAFDLDGGRPCLDFANTSGLSGEHLQAYADLLDFAAQSTLLTPELAEWLHAESRRAPAVAAATIERARQLRDALRAIFTAVADEQRPRPPDVHTLNAELTASLAHARIVLGEGLDAYAWGWADNDLTAPLWPILRSATDLLTSDAERRLVRVCGASDCAWLFLDSTRNRSRQWCSMASCGNREKARRHYQRVKTQRTSSTGAAPRGRAPGARTAAVQAGDASATAG